MEDNYTSIFGYLQMTDYSAIKRTVCLLSNQEFIHLIFNNQLSLEQLPMYINKIDSSIGNLSNIATLLYSNKESFLDTFFPKSYEPYNSALTLLDMSGMEVLAQQCAAIKEKWDIQENSDSSAEKQIKRENFTYWHKLLDMLYPKEEHEDLRTILLKRILYFHWILARTISIIKEITEKESACRANKEKCFMLFDKQKKTLLAEADKRIAEGHYDKDDLGWANNPLIFALQGKNFKDKLPNLYHACSSDGSPITESQMLEYVIYERLQNTSPGDGRLNKEMAERLPLVKDDPVSDQRIKQIIHDLPRIIPTLKTNEKGKYRIKGIIIAYVIFLAGKKAKPTNIFKYFQFLYETPSSYSNISMNVKDIKDGKISDEDPKKHKMYLNFKTFHEDIRDFYQETTSHITT